MVITIVFIVNGEEVVLQLDEDEPLFVAVNRALERTRNTGRPVQDWEPRGESGLLLLPDHKLRDHQRIFLTLQIGAGGCAARPRSEP